MRRATPGRFHNLDDTTNFYPRPPCGGRQVAQVVHRAQLDISIHALRAEGDAPLPGQRPTSLEDFYPRPPCGGRPAPIAWPLSGTNFYPRPPCGGRHHHLLKGDTTWQFLSTPSVRRATARRCSVTGIPRRFLSTPSVRRATRASCVYHSCIQISIHALRAEGDSKFGVSLPRRNDFYPRPPCGGRPLAAAKLRGDKLFLSTPSVRRATGRMRECGLTQKISIHALRAEGDDDFDAARRAILISIHALRAEGDPPRRADGRCAPYFYPRPPCGGRLSGTARATPTPRFLSTPSVRRATDRHAVLDGFIAISIHALRAEGDRRNRPGCRVHSDISIHALRAEGDQDTGQRLAVHGISIHALRAEGDGGARHTGVPRQISIHALRAEGDVRAVYPAIPDGISIHALRAEGDACFPAR